MANLGAVLEKFRDLHKKCFPFEYRMDDERRNINPEYPFTISGSRKALSSTIFGTSDIIEKLVEKNNGIIIDDNDERFKTYEDALDFANEINSINFYMETVLNQYVHNSQFKQQLDELVEPYVTMNKLSK